MRELNRVHIQLKREHIQFIIGNDHDGSNYHERKDGSNCLCNVDQASFAVCLISLLPYFKRVSKK